MYVGELQVVERPSASLTSDVEPVGALTRACEGGPSNGRQVEVDAHGTLGRQDGARQLRIVDGHGHGRGDTVAVFQLENDCGAKSGEARQLWKRDDHRTAGGLALRGHDLDAHPVELQIGPRSEHGCATPGERDEQQAPRESRP